MAIKWIGLEWCPDARDYRKEFVCDTDSDLAKLPAAPYGSTALVAATGKTCIVNASGQWIDTATGKVIPGAGVSNAPTGGTSGGSNAGNSGSSGSNSGGSGVSHWDDLDGKPFYDTRVFEDIKAEWDGNTNGRFMINYGDTTLYKISDEIPSIDELRAGKMTWNNGRSETFVYREIDSGYTFEEHDGGYVFPTWNGAIVIVVSETSQFADETGIYVANFSDYNEYIQSIEYKKIVAGELKTIDPAFLPAGVPYDTRKLKVIPPSTVSGTCVAFGNIKVADSVDFDISKVASMSLNVDGEMWLVDQPVETVRYDDMEHSPLFINTSDGWNFATYFENQAEADAVWDSDDPNPLEPGLYLHLDCDEGEQVAVAYAFTLCESGSMNPVMSTLLPEGVPHIDENGDWHPLAYDLLPEGVPYAYEDEYGNEHTSPIDERLMPSGILKLSQVELPTVHVDGLYLGNKLKDITFGNGVYVATSPGNQVFAYSRDLIEWVPGEAPTSFDYSGVAFGNGVFVANNSSNTQISYDGIAWTIIDVPFQFNPGTISFARDRFFAFGDNAVWYSYNAIDWFKCVLKDITNLYNQTASHAIAYGNGKFVITSTSGSTISPCAFYSEDGIVWYNSNLTGLKNVYYVVHGNGRFVVINGAPNRNSSSSVTMAYSEDGINWTTYTVSHDIRRIIFVNGMFVGIAGLGNKVVTSVDGVNWEQIAQVYPSSSTDDSYISYFNGRFVYYAPYVEEIQFSHDCRTWNKYIEAFIENDTDISDRVKQALGGENVAESHVFPDTVKHLYVASSTEGSKKLFKITVDDSGTLTATEVTA